jgi:di/tricarboxylate transporter
MTSMSEKDENQREYPVKTTHEFLSEMNHEWGRFKRGAILSTVICLVLLVGFVLVYLRISKTYGFEVSDLILVGLLAAFLVYTIYLMTTQYRFFRRWENRMKRIYGYEEKLLADENADQAGKQTN